MLRHAAASKAENSAWSQPKTLIITPNGNVSEQWKEHLLISGVHDDQVLVAVEGEVFQKTRHSWIVMTRYQVLGFRV